MDYLNLGINGRSVSDATHSEMIDNVDLIPLDTDYILIHAGTNDIDADVDLGTVPTVQT